MAPAAISTPRAVAGTTGVLRLLRDMLRWAQVSRTIREMQALSDSQLAGLGIARDEIPGLVVRRTIEGDY